MKFRSGYDGKNGDVSRETSLECNDESLTQQSSKDDADINVLMRRFGVTKVLPQVTRTPEYGDYAEVFDFQGSMNLIVQARNSFLELPAGVRKRFANDPQEFLTFVSDPANAQECVKLGLANVRKPVDKPVMDVRIVTPPDSPENKGDSHELSPRKSRNAARASASSVGRSEENSE